MNEDMKHEMPLGLGFTMSMNEAAMERFAAMSHAEKEAVIERSRKVESKAEMERIVENLAAGGKADGNHLT